MGMSRSSVFSALLLSSSLFVACGGETTDGPTGAAGTPGRGNDSGAGGTFGLGGSSGSAGSGSTGGTGVTAGAGGTISAGAGGTISAGAGGGGGSDTIVRIPKNHRAVATTCDDVRATIDPNVGTGPPASCKAHEECTEGVNGRCSGNSHDGWQCTYDLCKDDAGCGTGVCACEGGFRSDNNICLKSSCRVDADCGTNGFCSPSLGDCGHYVSFVTYACHTPKDECVDDEDCKDGGYCAFEETVGHWKCSTSECLG